MEKTQFYEKLNKVDGKTYVIEEEIWMPEGGIYEAELQHDNINTTTLAVYAGPKLTGESILTYVLSTPSLTPWKSIIRIQSATTKVYVSYETEGDTVEADDINRMQNAVVITQKALNTEEERALDAEAELSKTLMKKVDREEGKQLTSNDYSDAEKSIVSDINAKKHTHDNKTILNKITQVLLDNWTVAFNHISDSIRHIPSGGSSGQVLKRDSGGNAVWGTDNSITYSAFKGVTASGSGTEGLVPAPPTGSQGKFLRADGDWGIPESNYTHPSSGVPTGTYRNVTVNAQGHVIAGTNPTTLAGHGITDAATANHNHDGAYLKKGAITWNNLKGV